MEEQKILSRSNNIDVVKSSRTESHKKIRTLMNSTTKKVNPDDNWVKTNQFKILKEENENLVDEYRKFEQELRMKIKENREFKPKVLVHQKEFRDVKRACDEADEQILDLQVMHDDLLEDFTKNLTGETDNSFSSKNNFNSHIFPRNELESADPTNSSLDNQLFKLNARNNFSTVSNNSNMRILSENNTNNQIFHSNNSNTSNPQNIINHSKNQKNQFKSTTNKHQPAKNHANQKNKNLQKEEIISGKVNPNFFPK